MTGSDLRKITRALKDRGVTVAQGRTHLKGYRDGKLVCTFGCSPSDRRWLPNLERDLRSAGVLAPGEKLLGGR